MSSPGRTFSKYIICMVLGHFGAANFIIPHNTPAQIHPSIIVVGIPGLSRLF